ncbi:hypothetical protein SAMN05216257_102391 [Meinhardsimonia xiamenensis]|jgi:hypothetical protein|uniref:Uncharacterized protein n=1 Tax=Meinhardsimonia xiamenensis TaxID=990712 RepID=A0A1G9B3L3_9RHOB|nr:hypothetical protein [Meinhardsimonia xiamenensis]PRX35134.1 hypothetical protein LV81_01728 [Meinhardsimonia xiamenensis]SDK34129.1 hypothetical protein SAMN05216257_102391 [Meinhardsimonia xiamenensis]
MNREDILTYDPVEIEARARKLRAETTAAGLRAASRWIGRQLRRAASHLPGFGAHRHA